MMVLPGDVNFDGVVNIFDINLVSAHWGEIGPVADANHDMIVNIFDINLISANWSPPPGPGGAAARAVPEPASWLLFVFGLVVMAIPIVSRRHQGRFHGPTAMVADRASSLPCDV